MELGINWKDIFTISMILFAVIDIVGSIPIIVDLRSKMGHIQSEKATIVAAVIMIAFLFVGEEILKLIGIDANSFADILLIEKFLRNVHMDTFLKLLQCFPNRYAILSLVE